jgi:demethylmenaquinone methyltransferase/2-methoxy-6-polyprenyl-1,4-benzoquinol methylase
MEPAVKKVHALELFSGLPRHYDAMAGLLSFGQDRRWRRAMVDRVQASPADRVLDVATGTGMVAVELVRRHGCSVVGLDQSEPMLRRAREKLTAHPDLADRIELVEGEAEHLPFSDQEFDSLTFTYLLRYVDDPGATLRELARVVKPGGRIASLEFAVPSSRLVWAPWMLYTRVGLPALGRLASKDWYEVGRFLGPSISGFYERYPLSRVRELWAAAGIRSIEVRRMSLGGGVVIGGVRDDDG